MIAPIFRGKWLANHLNISSVWKSLVAICVRVAEVWVSVFNAFVSSTKVFVSSMKRVHFQSQKCSSPAQNVFVCSVISYLEVSSRDYYLVAGNKRVSLLHVLGSLLRNPPKKEQKLGKKFQQKFISSRDGPEKSKETRQRWKNARRLPDSGMMVENQDKNTTLHLQCIFLQMLGSLLLFLFAIVP